MKKIDWNKFDNDNDALEYLKKLPRYKNSLFKAVYYRARFFFSVLWYHVTKKEKPLFVVLVTNESCNLKCSYCYGNYGNRSKDYSTVELLKLIDDLCDQGSTLLTVHGGESLLRKDIGEIINYIKLKDFYVSINTNGYLLPNKIDEIKNVDAVCLSLDGRAENNDKHRGQGCFEKVMKAIDVLNEYNIQIVVSATLNKDTMNDIKYLAELGLEKNFKVQFHILYNSEALESNSLNIKMSDEEIRRSIKEIIELKKQNYPFYWSEKVLEIALNWPLSYDDKFYLTNEDKFDKKDLLKCYHGKLKYQIDADGRVVTCWAHNDADAPNIKELGVKGAIEQCKKNNKCEHCSFLANNEHNAVMGIRMNSLFNILKIQFLQLFKIK